MQAKHYQPDPPIGADVVEQLLSGMEAEDASLGWVATSGVFSPEAEERRNQIEDDTGHKIELIDGEQLAALIVDGGLRATSLEKW